MDLDCSPELPYHLHVEKHGFVLMVASYLPFPLFDLLVFHERTLRRRNWLAFYPSYDHIGGVQRGVFI
jgi:hypothetical protein